MSDSYLGRELHLMNEKKQKIAMIIQMMEEGVPRTEITERYGYKSFSSIDMFMRREGYSLKNDRFVKEEERSEERLKTWEKTNLPKQVIQSLRSSNVRVDQVAKKYGFETMEALGKMMRQAGYVWSDKEQTYCPVVLPSVTHTNPVVAEADSSVLFKVKEEGIPSSDALVTSEAGRDLIQYLLQHIGPLRRLLEEKMQEEQIGQPVPRYSFGPLRQNKTVTLPQSMSELIPLLAKDMNMTQGEIVTIGLIEFIMRYAPTYRTSLPEKNRRQD